MSRKLLAAINTQGYNGAGFVSSYLNFKSECRWGYDWAQLPIRFRFANLNWIYTRSWTGGGKLAYETDYCYFIQKALLCSKTVEVLGILKLNILVTLDKYLRYWYCQSTNAYRNKKWRKSITLFVSFYSDISLMLILFNKKCLNIKCETKCYCWVLFEIILNFNFIHSSALIFDILRAILSRSIWHEKGWG